MFKKSQSETAIATCPAISSNRRQQNGLLMQSIITHSGVLQAQKLFFHLVVLAHMLLNLLPK